MKNPISLVSIIIVNYNGKKWLQKCLDSLFEQTYTNFEIILVDNNSSDDSIEFLRSNYSDTRLKIIEHKENSGFAGGNNVGFKYARGEYIILLNNDTWVEKNYIINFITAFDEIPNLGCAQSKILLMDTPEKIDSAGSFWTKSTFLYHYGFFKNTNDKKYNVNYKVFSTKGASVIYRKDILDKVGLFDDKFWCYYEETDLNHRLWLAGYESWYYPGAICYHANGGTSLTFDNETIQFHNFKNKIRSFLKNFELITLIWVIPMHLLIITFLGIIWTLQGKFKYTQALAKAIMWNISVLGETYHLRKKIQKQRKLNDKKVFNMVEKNPRLSYYKALFTDLKQYED
jgi:GT2 family glycosyltransferase